MSVPECCPTLQPQLAARHMNHHPAILGPGKATTSAFISEGPGQPPRKAACASTLRIAVLLGWAPTSPGTN